MSGYVLAKNDAVIKYPYSLTDLRRDNPDISFSENIPEDIAANHNVYPVIIDPRPQYNEDLERLSIVAPVYNGDNWEQKWTIIPLSQGEIDARINSWREAASCTPFQGRMALSDAGQLADVEAAVAAADEKTKVAWEYALIWQRNSPMIAALASALSMTDAQIDDLFKAAAQISA